MTFKKTCPSCKAEDKIVKLCRHCYRQACSSCSVHGFCVDCFVSLHRSEEIDKYFEHKYAEVLAP